MTLYNVKFYQFNVFINPNNTFKTDGVPILCSERVFLGYPHELDLLKRAKKVFKMRRGVQLSNLRLIKNQNCYYLEYHTKQFGKRPIGKLTITEIEPKIKTENLKITSDLVINLDN